MAGYVIRRLVRLALAAFAVATLVFVIFRFVPGDPRPASGIAEPLPVQYARFLWGALHGNLGRSRYTHQSVAREIVQRYPPTLQLALASLALAALVGITLGVISATRPNSFLDNLARLLAVAGTSIPSFWLGLLLIVLFAVRLRWLPVTGIGSIRHLILPAITLGLPSTAIIARMTRVGMLDVMREDYIRTARAKGLTERAVILRHALKNSLIPTVTVVGLELGYLLGGSVVVESLFAWPGLGALLNDAVLKRDYPMIQATVLAFAITFMLLNLLVDILYACLDPRLRYT